VKAGWTMVFSLLFLMPFADTGSPRRTLVRGSLATVSNHASLNYFVPATAIAMTIPMHSAQSDAPRPE